ncbi:molybdenum ABC transporter ATP-binding protein [Geobacter sp.]|uniref:molybdenum ABC transporter ATP-binding protein n=1 Tax=Geobacter sp. TaxID=46610 RepID=UPI00261B6F8F|nr:molybdenum ABC transporter ATP-binding protein [Geobacter sp.]
MELSVRVTKSFGEFTLDAGFTVSGSRIGIFGESGSGKSTLVNMVAGLARPDGGEISLDGETLFSAGRRVNVPPERRRIALVFQHPHLFPHLPVRANLLYGWKRCAAANRQVRLDDIVDVLKIGHLLERGVNNLSGGEKQRIVLGRALLSNPRLLLMDEPLSALDDTLRFQIIPYLRGACEAFAIPYLFISHSLLEMRLMTDRVVVYERGRQAGETTPDELARLRMGTSPVGYINLLRLTDPLPRGNLFSYAWGGSRLVLSTPPNGGENLFELSSKDMILFKKHPEAISARNLLRCTVTGMFEAGRKVGVELACAGGRLVAEVAGDAARELELGEGSEVYAAIKASAFRRLG